MSTIEMFVISGATTLLILALPVADIWDWLCKTRPMQWYARLFNRLTSLMSKIGTKLQRQ